MMLSETAAERRENIVKYGLGSYHTQQEAAL